MRQVLRWPNLMSRYFIPITLLSIALNPTPSQALTASFGQPYHGRLVNGIPFPRQFDGYQLRDEDRTYTTPEVIGAMLDAIDAVQKQFPDSPNLYLGDFSLPGGGSMGGHRSHENGRDVDLGMYHSSRRSMDGFAPMNEENLDVPRTWALLESLLCSQRVQYIFVDRRIQNLFRDYALSRGMDPAYLDRLFGNNRGAVIQHVRNHVDHMHVRFYTPWSTMAAQVGDLDDQKRGAIEMAQQSYLPKKVLYYAKGNERSLDALAQSFGVHRNDMCRWNDIRGGEILNPGRCLVFYKRGFEFEPVHLAQSLQPDSVPESPAYQVASLRPVTPPTLTSSSISDVETAPRDRVRQTRERRTPTAPVTFSYKARRGDTIEKVARRNGIDPKELARANSMKTGSALRPGQKIKLAGFRMPSGPASCDLTPYRKGSGGKAEVMAGKHGKSGGRAEAKATSSREAPVTKASTAAGKSKIQTKNGSVQTSKSSPKTTTGSTAVRSVGTKTSDSRKAREAVKSSKVPSNPASPAKSTKSKEAAASSKGVSKPVEAAPKKALSGSKSVADQKTAPKAAPVSKSSAPAGIAKVVKASSKKVN
jgi:murein endopeptidase/LysM repeat protein